MASPPTISISDSLPSVGEFTAPSIFMDPIAARAAAADQYAKEIQSVVSNTIEALGAFDADQSLYESISDELFNIASAGLDGLNLAQPQAGEINYPVIGEPSTIIPALPEMTDSDIGVIGIVPPFDAVRPAINIPAAPNDDFPTFTETAPGLSDIQLATKPDYTLPSVPQIGDVTIPAPPEYNPTHFDVEAPVSELLAPEEAFAYNEAAYNSDLKDRLAQELFEQLVSKGTGLSEETEQAIWDRATARQIDENDKAYQEALNFHASRGFSLPEGVLNATLIEVNHRINQRRDDLNNDILVQQSNLAQANTHFIIQQALSLEQALMENSNQVQDRALEAAKATVQYANERYRVRLEEYVAKLEGYKVKAQVYETRIRAEIAKAEFYKAQIEGIKAGVEVKGLLIQAYTAQIEGIRAVIQMYAAEMEAAKIQSEVDKNRVEIYKTHAQVFGIRTDALTAKYNAYQAQIAGEAEKVKMYAAEAQAYTSRVQGFKAVADVEVAKAEVRLTKHKGDIEAFKATVEQYKVESDRLISQAQAEAQIEGVKIEKYRSDVQKYSADIEAIVRNFLGKVEKAKAEADVLVKEREVAIQKLLAEKGITADMITAQARMGSQLAAAAMTSVSASASVGLSQSQSKSISGSKSYSGSKSLSVSHNAHYQMD